MKKLIITVVLLACTCAQIASGSEVKPLEQANKIYMQLTIIDKNITYIGDGHGNTLKMLQHLLDLGIIKKSAKNKLWYILKIAYKDNNTNDFVEAIDQLFDQNNNYLEQDKINENKIVFIGDLLADRGQNDLFTLYLMDKMNKSSIEYKVVLSNHDWQFIKFVKSGKISELCAEEENELFFRSLINYKDTKEQQAEQYNFISLEQNYFKHLVALHYDPETKTLATHAPLPIQADFEKFFVEISPQKTCELGPSDSQQTPQQVTQIYQQLINNYKIKTIDELTEKINILFQTFFDTWEDYSSTYDAFYSFINTRFEYSENSYGYHCLEADQYPDTLFFSCLHKNINIQSIFGHDRPDYIYCFYQNSICLDNDFGRDDCTYTWFFGRSLQYERFSNNGDCNFHRAINKSKQDILDDFNALCSLCSENTGKNKIKIEYYIIQLLTKEYFNHKALDLALIKKHDILRKIYNINTKNPELIAIKNKIALTIYHNKSGYWSIGYWTLRCKIYYNPQEPILNHESTKNKSYSGATQTTWNVLSPSTS